MAFMERRQRRDAGRHRARVQTDGLAVPSGDGPVIDQPAELLREYIEHRLVRERQVLSALRTGLSDVDAMVSRIYPTLAAPLVPMARESVLAHLLKLEREGKVSREHDRWRLAQE